MSRIFLSHSSKDNFEAIALCDWLAARGWNDVFLDLDPERGIAAGERWERALHEAANRCEAVIFVVSSNWLASGWCLKEYALARGLNKKLFAAIVDPGKSIADLPPELAGTWQVVDLTGGQEPEILRTLLPGSHEEKHVTFSAEGLRRLRRGLEKAGLDPRFFAWPPENEKDRAPYRGLKPIESVDAGIFFGRDAPIVEAIDRLRGLRAAAAPRLLVILGASGAGKSSFLRAGLLPRLARDDAHFLPLPAIRPEQAALFGENGLLGALEKILPSRTRADLREAILAGTSRMRRLLAELAAAAFARTLADAASAIPPAIVIAVDQAEELFRAEGAEEGAGLLSLLRDLVMEDDLSVIVLFAIRSDSYDDLEHAKAFEGLPQSTLPLLPMPRGAYKEVIEGPAKRLVESGRKLTIEPGLTEHLLADIEKGGGKDALPLLAFTLEQLTREYGAAGSLCLADYERFGEIGGAIEKSVERALKAANKDPRIPIDREARLALLRRGLIPWLAGIEPDSRSPRRNIARYADIPVEARPLIDLLVEERLLSTDVANDSGERTIEPAHEALLRQWGLLKGWLAEDLGLLATLEGVKRGARDWDANTRSPAWLAHQGQRLTESRALIIERPDIAARFDEVDKAYLDLCQAKEQTQQAEKDRRRRRSLAALVIVVVGLSAAAIISFYQWQALGRTRIEAKLIAYQDAVKKAQQSTFTKGPRPTDQTLQFVRTALALSDEIKNMRGTPPETADADAVKLYEVAAINSAEVGDPAGAERYLEMRRALLRRSPELEKKAGSVLGYDPAALTVLDLQMELLIANESLQEKLAPGKDHNGMQIYHNYEVVLTTLNHESPRDASFNWLRYMQFLQARDYERTNDLDHSRQEWENRIQTERDHLAWARSNSGVLDAERKRMIGDAAGGITDSQDDLALFYQRHRDYEQMLSVAREEVNTIDTIPELTGEFNRRWRAHLTVAGALDGLGRREMAKQERDAAAEEFVAAGYRRSEEAQRGQSRNLQIVGDAKSQAGDPAGALTAYDGSLVILRKLVADKDDADAERALSAGLDEIGKAKLQAGDRPGALAAYEEMVSLARKLAADKDNSEARRDLSLGLDKIGSVKSQAGDWTGSLAAYEESLAIRRELAKGVGDNSAQRDLWLIPLRDGDAKLQAGNMAGAFAAYQESAAKIGESAAKARRDARARRDLAVGLSAVAGVKSKAGDQRGALASYEECLVIRRQLADDAAKNALGRRELMAGLENFQKATAQGDFKDGLTALGRRIAVSQELLQDDEDKATAQGDLLITLEAVGDIESRLDDQVRALAAYQEMLVIARELAKDKDDANSQHDLSVSLAKVGTAKEKGRDWEGALAAYNESLAIRRDLAKDKGKGKGKAQAQIDLGVGLENVADALKGLDRLPDAAPYDEEDLAIFQDLADHAPNDEDSQKDLAIALGRFGTDLRKLGRLDEALTDYEKEFSIRRALLLAHPSEESARDNLDAAAENIGGLAYDFLLVRAFDKSLTASDQAIAAAPDQIWIYANRAHALMFLGRTDEARVLYLAHRGEKLAPDESDLWEKAVLDDFAALRKAGLTDPLMNEIERLFKR